MNQHTVKVASARPALVKADAGSPALVVTGRDVIAVRAGTFFAGRAFDADTAVALPDGGFEPGCDYDVSFAVGVDTPLCSRATSIPSGDTLLGGFHFAPGGNAAARSGGDDVPAINPSSLWDLSFRPACPDPRGMTLVEGPYGRFWVDIYLLGRDHLEQGTSRFGVTIADGDDPPQNPAGGHFDQLDYEVAMAVMKHHGKGLLSFEEFAAAAIGVTERTAHRDDPRVTRLDAPRTSRRGVMQAAGSLWAWGHDGDPDEPRASLFGGSWLSGGVAGSRFANLGRWADYSSGDLGARGRSDHLQLA